MEDWNEYQLDEIIDINPRERLSKGTIATKVPMEGVYPFTKRIVSYGPEEYKGGVKFRNGDTLMARITPSLENGKTAMVDILEDDEVGFGSTEFIVLREREDLSDNGFIYYLATSPELREIAIQSMTGSSGRQRVQTDVVKEFNFLLPPLPEQKAIAEVLSSLDVKINLLHRQNQKLEELAEVLFRKWFILDIDPEGTELFLSDVADHHKQSVKPFEEPFQVYHHYSIPAFDDGQNPQLELGDNIRSNKYQVLTNSILISKLNPRFPRVWQVSKPIDEDFSICSTEFQVVVPHDEQLFAFIYYFLKSQPVTDELIGAAGGTSGSHQRVSPEDIFNLSFVKPQDDRLEKFHQIATSNLQKINNNREQIQKLIKLRNALLPKLMSGEVRVKNIKNE